MKTASHLLLLLPLWLAACSSSPLPERDRPPTQISKDPWQAVEPAVQALPRSRYGNPAEYVVFGKTYRTLPSAAGYKQRGVASWYGEKFHGRRTSSGEIFDMYELTAAHRELPIPCIAQVTNLANGRSIRVRINDRGPFHADRMLDLSWAAAVRLGVTESGTAPVEVVVLGHAEGVTRAPGGPTPARAAAPAPQAADRRGERPSAFFLQVGAFRDPQLAAASAQRFSAMGYPVHSSSPARDGWLRVWLGPWPDAPSAEHIAADLARHRIDSLLIAQ